MKRPKNFTEDADWSAPSYILRRFRQIDIGESISQSELYDSARATYDKFTKQYYYVLLNQLIKTKRVKRSERFSKNPVLTKLIEMPESWSYITYELRAQKNMSCLDIVRTGSPLLNFDFTRDAEGSTIFSNCTIQPIQFIIATQINNVGAAVLRNVIKATLYETAGAQRELEKAMHLLHVARVYGISFALNAGVYKLAEEVINEYVEKESLSQEMKGLIVDLYESEWDSAIDTLKKFYSGEYLIKVNKE
jgi:hypothetical protein